MDFALTANQNGPSDPFNITLRGADPLYSLPVGHALRRAGFNLQATPGGLNASLDNLLGQDLRGVGHGGIFTVDFHVDGGHRTVQL